MCDGITWWMAAFTLTKLTCYRPRRCCPRGQNHQVQQPWKSLLHAELNRMSPTPEPTPRKNREAAILCVRSHLWTWLWCHTQRTPETCGSKDYNCAGTAFASRKISLFSIFSAWREASCFTTCRRGITCRRTRPLCFCCRSWRALNTCTRSASFTWTSR